MEEDAYNTFMQQNATTSDGAVGMVLMAAIMSVSILSAVGAMLSFLFTLQFFRVPDEHRKMKLGAIWLLMIPLFGVGWLYMTVWRLAMSFRAYFDSLDPEADDFVQVHSDFGMKRGLWMTLAAVGVHAATFLAATKSPLILGLGLGLASAAGLTLTVLYFLQVFKVRNLLPDPEAEILPESYL